MVQCCYQQVECSTVGTAPRKFSSVSLQLAEDKLGFLHCPDLYFVSQIIYKMIIPTRNYTHVACVYGHWLLLICCPLLNGCEGSMGIMKQCLCFWVLSGIRSATVWVFYVLVLIGGPQCVSEHMSLSDRPCEPTSNLYIVCEALRNGRVHTVADGALTPFVWMNPAERSLRPGSQLLNHTQRVNMHVHDRAISRLPHYVK